MSQPTLVASAAYGFVRLIGGGPAPSVAGRMFDAWDIHVPFVVGAVAVAVAVGIAVLAHPTGPDAGEVADEFGGAPGAVDEEVQAEHARARA